MIVSVENDIQVLLKVFDTTPHAAFRDALSYGKELYRSNACWKRHMLILLLSSRERPHTWRIYHPFYGHFGHGEAPHAL